MWPTLAVESIADVAGRTTARVATGRVVAGCVGRSVALVRSGEALVVLDARTVAGTHETVDAVAFVGTRCVNAARVDTAAIATRRTLVLIWITSGTHSVSLRLFFLARGAVCFL